MKCCLNFLTVDGRMIPFCAYNSAGYRERMTEQLISQSVHEHDMSLENAIGQDVQ
jgi:hypothetical protein